MPRPSEFFMTIQELSSLYPDVSDKLNQLDSDPSTSDWVYKERGVIVGIKSKYIEAFKTRFQ